jgi:hypothetical protein
MRSVTKSHPESPWIETHAGTRVFGLLLLAMPLILVGVPLIVRAFADLVAPDRDPSAFVDTIPAMAAWALPRIGWAAGIPVVVGLRTLQLELPRPARTAVRTVVAAYATILLGAVVTGVPLLVGFLG